MEQRLFLERFSVPEAAYEAVYQMVNEQEIHLIEHVACDGKKNWFSVEEAAATLRLDSSQTADLLGKAYQRGVVELEDESGSQYRIGSFYSRLDIFAVSETEKWLSLPLKLRIELDDWYFHAYLKKLDTEQEVPTADVVASLEETLTHLDGFEGQIWLNKCDCRTLAGKCGKTTEVCLSFRNGINTFSHRGLSKPISKEAAREIVKTADQEGLMHTLNPGGICNCCGDCCYLFRAQEARDSNPMWPSAKWIALVDHDKCIGCGLCVQRCHFNAFCEDSKAVRYDPLRCRGCGICSGTCPTGAIKMMNRRG